MINMKYNITIDKINFVRQMFSLFKCTTFMYLKQISFIFITKNVESLNSNYTTKNEGSSDV